MKKLIILAIIIIVIVIGCTILSSSDHDNLANTDEVVLVFENNIPTSDYQVVNEFLKLLKQVGVIGVYEENIYSQHLENNVLAIFVPKNSISSNQQKAIKEQIENKYKQYQALKIAKTNEATELLYDMKFELVIGPRVFPITDLIKDKEALANYKKDTAPYEKHYVQTVTLGKKQELESTMFGVRVKKACAISLQTKSIPYQQIGIKKYMSEETKKAFFRYSSPYQEQDLYAKLLFINGHFKEGSELAKIMADNPNYRISTVPNRPVNRYQPYQSYQNRQPPPTSSSLYLVYDEIDIKPSQKMTEVRSCEWPANIPIPATNYLKENGFATSVIGIQFLSHH